jgi:hypothetical protein
MTTPEDVMLSTTWSDRMHTVPPTPPPFNPAPWNPPLLRKRSYDIDEDIWRDGPLPMDVLEALLMRRLKEN